MPYVPLKIPRTRLSLRVVCSFSQFHLYTPSSVEMSRLWNSACYAPTPRVKSSDHEWQNSSASVSGQLRWTLNGGASLSIEGCATSNTLLELSDVPYCTPCRWCFQVLRHDHTSLGKQRLAPLSMWFIWLPQKHQHRLAVISPSQQCPSMRLGVPRMTKANPPNPWYNRSHSHPNNGCSSGFWWMTQSTDLLNWIFFGVASWNGKDCTKQSLHMPNKLFGTDEVDGDDHNDTTLRHGNDEIVMILKWWWW